MDRSVASVYLWFDVGAQDERAGSEGTAHFVEHMIFKGTRNLGVGEVAQKIEGMGGDLNAYTSHDATVLHATVESSSWEEAFEVLCEMAWHSNFDPEEVGRERQVILEEIASYDDDPGAVVQEAASAALFGSHPYGRPVLGTRESVSGISAEQLLKFWRTHYVPSRTLLAFAGPIDTARVASLIDQWVPRDRKGTVPPQRTPVEPYEPCETFPDRSFDTTMVHLAWRTPGIESHDLAALDVLTAALGQGHGAKATLELQLRREMVLDVWCEHQPLRQGGVWMLGMTPLPGQASQAVEHALALVEQVRKQGLSGREVQRARDALLADMLFEEETTDGVAHDLVWFTAHHGSPDARQHWRDTLASVTAEHVQEVAQRWLGAGRHVVAATGPDSGALRSMPRAAPQAKPARPSFPGPTHTDLGRGLHLASWRDDSPVVAIRVAALGGGMRERLPTAGRGVAWSHMITSGAGGMNEEALAREVDALGGVLSPFVSKTQVGIGLSLPACHTEDGLALLRQLLLEPHFDEDTWARVQNELLESLRTVKDRPAQLARESAWASLWPHHPWRLPLGGTERSLNKLRPATLRRYHRESLCTPGLLVSIAGGVDPEWVAQQVESWAPHLPHSEPFSPPPAPSPPRLITRRVEAGHHQALVAWTARAPVMGDEAYHPLRLALSILGGQSGRLFQALREELGLAYSVWAQTQASPFGGVTTTGLATSPARKNEARAALTEVLEAFALDGPKPEEVARCRQMMLGHTAMSLQSCTGRVAALSNATLYQQSFELDTYRDLLLQIQPGAIRDAFAACWVAGGTWVEVSPS
jgi:zinc protease